MELTDRLAKEEKVSKAYELAEAKMIQ